MKQKQKDKTEKENPTPTEKYERVMIIDNVIGMQIELESSSQTIYRLLELAAVLKDNFRENNKTDKRKDYLG